MAHRPFTIASELDRKRAADFVGRLALSDPNGRPKLWEMTIKPKKKRRTLPQNALYWKWISIIADDVGEDKDRIHEAYKAMFLPPRLVALGGTTVPVYDSHDMPVGEFSDYCEKVYAHATQELGILLPLPEEMHQR